MENKRKHSGKSKVSNNSSIINEGNLTPERVSESSAPGNGSMKESELMNDNFSDSQIESDFGKEDKNQFTALLGLPQISLESIYQSYKEKDINVVKLM